MIEMGFIAHYCALFLLAVSGIIANGFAGGYIGQAALEAIERQPQARTRITRAALLGLAFIETPLILGLLLVIFIVVKPKDLETIHAFYSHISLWFVFGIPAFFVTLYSARVVQSACYAIARDPFVAQQIINVMFLGQALSQTAVVFGFGLSSMCLLANFHTALNNEVYIIMTYIIAAICFGIASIGPVISMSNLAATACETLGKNRALYGRLVSFICIVGAIIETPLIFALIISSSLMIFSSTADMLSIVRACAAAGCMGFGTYGCAINLGYVGISCMQAMSLYAQQATSIMQIAMGALGIIDASAIYLFMISLLIQFM